MAETTPASKLDITKLISALDELGGVAETSRITTIITLPKALSAAGNSEKISLFCYGAELPGMSIGTDNGSTPYGFGPTYKMPWGVVFNDLDLNFFGDSKGFVHATFMKWLDSVVKFNASAMNTPVAGAQPFFISYREDYTTTVQILALDVSTNTFIKYTLFDAYPYQVAQIQGDWRQTNNMMSVNVKFHFSRYNVEYEKLTPEEFSGVKDLSQEIYSTSIQDNFSATPTFRADFDVETTAKLMVPTQSSSMLRTVNSYKDVVQYLPTTDYNI